MLLKNTLRKRIFTWLGLSLGLLSLTACSTISSGYSAFSESARYVAVAITPYKIDIIQGNFVSREAAAQLKPGMTREQVQYWVGTPLIADVFHANRWDYIFTMKRGHSEVVQQRRLTVFFEDNKLVKTEGDPLPSEYELIQEMDGIKTAAK